MLSSTVCILSIFVTNTSLHLKISVGGCIHQSFITGLAVQAESRYTFNERGTLYLLELWSNDTFHIAVFTWEDAKWPGYEVIRTYIYICTSDFYITILWLIAFSIPSFFQRGRNIPRGIFFYACSFEKKRRKFRADSYTRTEKIKDWKKADLHESKKFARRQYCRAETD